MTVLDVSRMNSIREAAARASADNDNNPNGWSQSIADPMKLLACFPALRIKSGYILRAYQFKEEGNGNGFVWAMPIDADFPQPEDCPTQEGRFLQPPKPTQSLDQLMDAIEGDDTPWSHFSASIFSREASEFGAIWHGCQWSTHTILGTDPWQCDPDAKDRRKRQALASGTTDEWTWNADRPETWGPTYSEQEDIVTIKFHTFSGLAQESIFRFTDTFHKGRFNFATQEDTIAEGPHGYIF